MESAILSEEAAAGRYKEGVGSILDLLSAQRALAAARAEQINARLGWFTALARLAHDTGILGIHGDNPLAPGALQPR
jgi:outer membrane protein TolC